jgi:polyisoprenoid-binding protein YceI
MDGRRRGGGRWGGRLGLACAAIGLYVGGLISAGSAWPAVEIPQARYVIAPDGARLSFRVHRLGLFDSVGRFDAVSGVLDTRPPPARNVLSVTIRTASIGSDSESLTGTLRGPDFFDVARYPEIGFVARGVAPLAGTTARVTGQLTMRGVTHPATFEVVFRPAAAGGPSAIRFSARGVISRSDYGMTAYRPFVSDAVRLDLEAVLVRPPGAAPKGPGDRSTFP